MNMQKKAQAISGLQAMIAPLVGVAIVLAVGFLIMAEAQEQAIAIEGSGGYADNGTNEVMKAMDDIPGWLPIIVVAVIGAILLGLVSYFRAR